jgi:hypothetical protein
VNNEFERMWKEAGVASFGTLSWHWLAGLRKIMRGLVRITGVRTEI